MCHRDKIKGTKTRKNKRKVCNEVVIKTRIYDIRLETSLLRQIDFNYHLFCMHHRLGDEAEDVAMKEANARIKSTSCQRRCRSTITASLT